MMDMSATELWKTLKPGVGAILTALCLSVAGCSVPQPAATARTTPLPHADPKAAGQPAAPPQPAEAPPKTPAPAPQHVQRLAQPVPPPAVPAKGAEKLVAPKQPLLVRARERTPAPPEPSVSNANVAEISGTTTNAPVEALIVRGPPHQAPPPRWTVLKVLLWLGLGLAGAGVVVAARLYLIRRAKGTEDPAPVKEELKMPRGMGFKEPINAPQAPALAEEP
jgi:hypothetical protein